jgi:UDP-N-acetylmuramoyl-L-alanyl-D-glutamate--2,6-diaminopimelate ligase
MILNQLGKNIHSRPAAMKLSRLINDVPVVQVFGPHDVEVSGITTDSRNVQDRTLFIATVGEHADSHRFVQSAIEQGASCVVVQRRQFEAGLADVLSPAYAAHNATAVVVVEDTRIACAIISDRYYGSPSKKMKLVGITGTNGKTTTAFLVKSILEEAGEQVGLIGTIEYQIGRQVIPASFTTPPPDVLHKLFADMFAAGCTSVVMEVSSHALALNRVYGVSFDVTLFTNLTQDHLDFHKTPEAYRDAKALLFSGHTKKFGILNADDPAWKYFGDILGRKKRTFGMEKKATFHMKDVIISDKETMLLVENHDATVRLSSKLLGRFNASNLAGAYAVGKMLGIESDVIVHGLKKVRSIRGRLERIRSQDRVTAIVDYAHTPDALTKAIETIREFKKPTNRLITVFGCGGDRDQGKRPLMGRIVSSMSDITIVTSDNPRSEKPEKIINEILKGVVKTGNVIVKPDRKAAIHHALKMARPGDLVLIAGKGHENYQLVEGKSKHFDDGEVIRGYFDAHRGGVLS